MTLSGVIKHEVFYSTHLGIYFLYSSSLTIHEEKCLSYYITMPHLNNHRAVHRDVNVTNIVLSNSDIQTEVDVVIGGRWARKF